MVLNSPSNVVFYEQNNAETIRQHKNKIETFLALSRAVVGFNKKVKERLTNCLILFLSHLAACGKASR